MASIENRSQYLVTVKHRDDLKQTFAHSAKKKADAYVESLKGQRLKPKLSRLDDYFVVRVRSGSDKNQTLVARIEKEANDIKNRLEGERRHGLFVNYAQAHKVAYLFGGGRLRAGIHPARETAQVRRETP
ncbi:hypothetical protein [Caballeronia sp. GAWG2-1]|uniref:hypothetical protein n=1 Tax=Caballeronia sp. GAWG2-1 TaxID=2921744 RepID=UPI002027E8A3|nr:hypothetical protein [Caballeronia sp. GAWG2-1]